MSFPASTLDLAGFCQGVHTADPTAEIHLFRTGVMSAPLLEVWNVNQSQALGCDVVWVHSLMITGQQWASRLGLMSVGFFSDARLTLGETVLTSVVIELIPAFVRVAEAVLHGTLRAEMQRPDWWMGWDWGAMRLADFSFLVPPDVQAKVRAQMPTLDRIFCGRVCTRSQCFCNASTCCLTDPQLNALGGALDFVLDHGVMKLPGEACRPGNLATWHLKTFTMTCSNCPAGTYAFNAAQTSECRPCPAGTFSPPGAANCTACPPGTYGNQSGLGQCAGCPAGGIAHNPASVACSPCRSGLSTADRTRCDEPALGWVAAPCAGVAAALLLVVACTLWCVRWQGQRNNRAAPKDPSKAFCIIFTDIQGSTSLWAAIPDVMAAALNAHHALLRRLIAKYHCYEVKTIGDSFMCATQAPTQALHFALALQEELVRRDWGTDCLDQTYAELIQEPSGTPGCWNGLRVRAGIHYGYGDIKLDPTSKGYDYYGTVVNTAARIESVCHGGQTGVSAVVFEAVGGHCPGAVWADLGLQPLRGLAEPIHLYQVLPEGLLAQRRFPPLRVDRVDRREEVLEEPAVPQEMARTRSWHGTAVAPTASASSVCGRRDSRWAETHPLVARGKATAEDLQWHSQVLQAGLTHLLAPLATAGRPPLSRQLLSELCAAFHVPNPGNERNHIVHALDGLVKRVVPSTLLSEQSHRNAEDAD